MGVSTTALLCLPTAASAQSGASTAQDTASSSSQSGTPATDPSQQGVSTTSGQAAAQEIIVTGLRGSLQRNLDIKRNSVGIVDAISSEDIGKFPDSNVASAMQRIPGVSISRGTSSLGGLPTTTGDATAITVRGFGPAFNETLYDGRKVSTGTSNRGFDFSTIGADFVGELDVLKTPDASLSAGAIGATINIKYPKPFDHPGLRVAGSVSGSYSPEAGNAAPSGGVLVSDTFADDTIGILADFAYTEHKTRENHINTQGWEGTQFSASQLAGAPPGASTVKNINGWYIQDYGIYQEHTDDQRIDGRFVLQWHPSDSVMVTLNDNYSREKVSQDQYGYSIWFNAGSLTNIVQNGHGTVTNFNQPNTPTDFQSQVNAEVLQNNEYGLNVKWDATSRLNLEFDADRAQSWLNPNGEISSIDSDVGYGYCTPAGVCTNTNNVGISLGGKNGVPVPTQYGPNNNHAAFFDPTILGSHVFPISSAQNKDTVTQFRFQGTWTGDDIKIRIGAQYVSDHFKLRGYDTLTNNDWQAYSGYGPASNSPTGVALPTSFFTNSFSTAGFIPGLNSSGLPPRILVFNPYQVLNYLQGLGNPQTQNIPGFNNSATAYNGIYQLAENPGNHQNINEDVWSGYATVSGKTLIFGKPLTINFGLRGEITQVTSTGLGQLPTGLAIQPGDHTAFIVTLTDPVPVRMKNHYTYILPNIDFGLAVTDRLKLRLDASRTLTRPPLNYLNPVLTVGTGQRVGSLVANGGNAQLQPYLSDNLDVGAEWYYARNSYFSIDGFLKHVTNFVVAGADQQTINGVIDPTTGLPGVFTVSTRVNGPSAVVRGLEVALQHVFGNSGFGFQANATFVDTNKPYDPTNLAISGFAVTGLANSANFVGFYDKNGFQARVAVNWRDNQLDHFGQQQNNSAFGAEPTYVKASTQVDFSSSYDINKHLSIFFEALNLNDAIYQTYGRYSEQVLDTISYGRRFTLGAHMRF